MSFGRTNNCHWKRRVIVALQHVENVCNKQIMNVTKTIPECAIVALQHVENVCNKQIMNVTKTIPECAMEMNHCTFCLISREYKAHSTYLLLHVFSEQLSCAIWKRDTHCFYLDAYTYFRVGLNRVSQPDCYSFHTWYGILFSRCHFLFFGDCAWNYHRQNNSSGLML